MGIFLICFQVFHSTFVIPFKQSDSRKCYTDSVMTFATQRQRIQILLSVAGAAIEDKIDRKNLDILQFSLYTLCFTGTTCSYLQGFVIPNQTFSNRWPEIVRTGQSQDGTGTELSATGTLASQGWHIPFHLPQVLPGGYTPPLPWQFTPAAVQACRLSRRTKQKTGG